MFYQYRPCSCNAYTIYDIENIQHGVVFARSPLKMNDPFDSQIGFSSDKLYEEMISAILNGLPIEKEKKDFLFVILKNKALGKTAELLSALNTLKRYIKETRNTMRLSNASTAAFVEQFKKRSYGKIPKEIKNFFSTETYLSFVAFVDSISEDIITEEMVNKAIKAEEYFQKLYDIICHMQEKVFPEKRDEFLSTIAVSCFSASGWNNQLMWAHYANSYSGICIEYDFNLMKDFIGFMYPVKYSKTRPVISLNELGIAGFDPISEKKIIEKDVDIYTIMKYLYVKNDCWQYEKEWRLLKHPIQPDTPTFIEAPFIKSITIGHKTDEICKRLIIDICREKGIDCYSLKASYDSFELKRELITDFSFEEEEEQRYIEKMGGKIQNEQDYLLSLFKKFNGDDKPININLVDSTLFLQIIQYLSDYLADFYFFCYALKRFCMETDIDTSVSKILGIDKKTSLSDLRTALHTYSFIIQKMRENKSINDSDYQKATQQLSDSNKMLDKINSI